MSDGKKNKIMKPGQVSAKLEDLVAIDVTEVSTVPSTPKSVPSFEDKVEKSNEAFVNTGKAVKPGKSSRLAKVAERSAAGNDSQASEGKKANANEESASKVEKSKAELRKDRQAIQVNLFRYSFSFQQGCSQGFFYRLRL